MIDNPTVADMMEAYSLDAVDMAKSNFGEELDFSERSVQVVERCLKQLRDTIPKGFFGKLVGRGPSSEDIETVAKMFGGYIGEVFRKHHGGEWIIDETMDVHDPVIAVQHSSGGKFFPPAKAHKRITNGQEDNVWVYYQVLTREYIKRAQE